MAFASPQAVSRLFPDSATVEQRTISRTDEGGETETWSTRHGDVACQFSVFSPGSGARDEEREPGAIRVSAQRRAILLGDWDDIVTSDRVLISGHTYDITGVERDSYAIVTTLCVEEREP